MVSLGSPSSTAIVIRYQQKLELTAPEPVSCAAFSSSGSLLACGVSHLLRVWKTDNGQTLYNFTGESNVLSVLWGRHNTLYCGYASGNIVVKVFDERKMVRICLVFIITLA